jgi:hypothetical protein
MVAMFVNGSGQNEQSLETDDGRQVMANDHVAFGKVS